MLKAPTPERIGPSRGFGLAGSQAAVKFRVPPKGSAGC